MDAVQSGTDLPPAIELQQVSVEWHAAMECWSIDWKIVNKGIGPLKILSVCLPHGQFKAEEQRFDPVMRLDSAESREFDTIVRCKEPEGLVTENAFLIFQVIWSGEPWRIFTRVRVVVDSKGQPKTAVELITTQKIGFSGVSP